jgi:hypothetical protein
MSDGQSQITNRKSPMTRWPDDPTVQLRYNAFDYGYKT